MSKREKIFAIILIAVGALAAISDVVHSGDVSIGGDLTVTGTISGAGQRAMMFDEDNTDEFVINDTGLSHVYHTNGMASKLLNGWVFDQGGAGVSFPIASVADGDSGEIAVTTTGSHGLAVGDIVSQTNMSVVAYDGVFHVNTINSTTIYEVTATWDVSATGTMDQAATLTAGTGSGGTYAVRWGSSATNATTNETFDFYIHVEAAAVTGTKSRRKFSTATDFGSFGMPGALVTIADGDKVALSITNNDTSANITLRNYTLMLDKL